MCCIKILLTAILLSPAFVNAQSRTSIEQYHVVGNDRNYIPISIANFQNEKKWYAEGRYNYEEAETFSLYIGKTFAKQSRLSYSLTPMLGGALGNFNGISAGINAHFDYLNFYLSIQSQYSHSTDHRIDNFFYNWSEVAYQPIKWLYGGISVQHTRLYRTETLLEPGILVGFSFRNLSIPLYSFAPFKSSRYFMIGLEIEWERSREKRPVKQTLAELSNE